MASQPQRSRARRAVYVTAMALGLGVGAAGVAAAGSNIGGSDTEADDGPEDSAGERAEEQAYTDAHRADAATSQAEAEAAAVAVKPGQLVETHLQDEGDGLRWEVKTDDGKTTWEIQVDARSGVVVSVRVDD